jgi:hypothetical protein
VGLNEIVGMKGVLEASKPPEPPTNSTSPQPVGIDPVSLREELDRVIASHHFQTSKRCQAFLRYAFEQTLSGRQELKERSIGIEVFGRNPSYDTNLDPVVRMTAGEVRKRLALYYQSVPGSEIRMELPVGGYALRFATHLEHHEYALNGRLASDRDLSVPQLLGTAEETEDKAVPLVPEARSPHSMRWVIAACATAFVCIAGIAGWSLMHRGGHPQRTPIDQFWAPFVASPHPTHISIGQIRPVFAQVEPNQLRSPINGPMALGKKTGYPRQVAVTVLGDGIAMADIAALLKAQGKDFNIRAESSTSFSDLQQEPSVLIGAFNNDWTIMMTHPLRFYFDLDDSKDATWIADREQPGVRIGYIAPNRMVNDMKEDYGLVVRMYDTRTQQYVVITAGLTPYATQATGAFVTDPASIAELAKRLPPNWAQKNTEVLIRTDLIDGEAGPPQIVATNSW